MSKLYQRIYEIVRQIPPGKVATYGQIALLAGNPRLSRVVGYALHIAPDDVPCHRVVNRKGETAVTFLQQQSLLEQEGICFTADGRVDLRLYGWHLL